MLRLFYLMASHKFCRLFFFTLFFLLATLDNFKCSVFKLTDSFFCLI